LSEDKETVIFTILCPKNTNYKILYICAHEMAKNGHQVTVLKDGHRIESMVAFLRKHFLPKQEAASQTK
jgi:hypothetical protein